MKRIIPYIIFFSIGGFIIWFFSWLANSPDAYIDDIKQSFSGVIIEKYNYRGSLHFKLKTDSTIINIGELNKLLFESAFVGDSILKPKSSNCCTVLNDSTSFKFIFFDIPEDVLNRSEYLQNIVNKGCN